MKKKIIGHNFLHRHLGMERSYNVPEGHVIVDEDEWKDVVNFFHNNPEIFQQLLDGSTLDEMLIINEACKDSDVSDKYFKETLSRRSRNNKSDKG